VCPLVWLAEIGLRRWCSEADRGTTFSCQWEYVTSHEPEIKAGDAGACARTFLPDPFAQPGKLREISTPPPGPLFNT
jgi:hypothetical protein